MRSTKSNLKQPPKLWRFDAIGTHWSIETPDDLALDIKTKITVCITDFDEVYSRFRDDSLVARIAKRSGNYTFPEDSIDLIDLYRRFYDLTNGAMTPLVGDTLEALGYDKQYSLQPKARKDVLDWDNVMQWEAATVDVRTPLTLDFGAIGKGYLVDKIAAILKENSITEHVIDASGDILHRGPRQLVIGLENPHDPTMVVGTAVIQNASLCGSAVNRRKWGDGLHHVIDGRTGSPTNDIIATWAIAPTTALADGLATALFFVEDVKTLRPLGSFDFVRMYANGRIEHSESFVGELFI